MASMWTALGTGLGVVAAATLAVVLPGAGTVLGSALLYLALKAALIAAVPALCTFAGTTADASIEADLADEKEATEKRVEDAQVANQRFESQVEGFASTTTTSGSNGSGGIKFDAGGDDDSGTVSSEPSERRNPRVTTGHG